MKKLDPSASGSSTLIGVRVTPTILNAIDRLSERAEVTTPAGPVRLSARTLSRAEALRIAAEVGLKQMGLLAEDTDINDTKKRSTHQALPMAEAPVVPQEPASQAKKTKKKPFLQDEVIATLRARTPKSKARSIEIASVVRELVSKGYEQALVLKTLIALDREGVLELRPESGAGLLSKQDLSLCPQGPTGPLSSAVWR